ncbi:hypothetical protein DFP72DRAFT_1177848 [Ephemerocybe angulata]|uniref:Uncharacterized protein n=1 Tax=Ephemerocybe angulata TaxID=980116 RepID=A0A8H6LWB7_9AGAR|nr:hypothetical protein DFP72DRAFT_1177848 [Tulosesus angulatus]
MPSVSDIAALDAKQQNYALLGFWLGGVVYGAYCILYGLSVKVTLETRRVHSTHSARIFPTATLLIFILATIYMGKRIHDLAASVPEKSPHIGLNASRTLYAFSPQWTEDSGDQLPIYHIRDYTSSKGFTTMLLMSIIIWLGDALAIYRCFVIWDMNWLAVLLPIALLVLSIVNSTVVDVAYKQPGALPSQDVQALIGIVFPVNITQNCLTTGLIVFRIWRQNRVSRAAGLHVHGRGIGLFTIMRIIVESAMIFTVQQIILCVLYYLGSPTQYVFNEILVPSIGCIFALMSIRVYGVKQEVSTEVQLSHIYSGLSVRPDNLTEKGHPIPQDGGRNHRRATSEALVFSRSEGSPTDHSWHPTESMGGEKGQNVDVEKEAAQSDSEFVQDSGGAATDSSKVPM